MMKKVSITVILIGLGTNCAIAKTRGTKPSRKRDVEQTVIRIEGELENASLNLDPAPYEQHFLTGSNDQVDLLK